MCSSPVYTRNIVHWTKTLNNQSFYYKGTSSVGFDGFYHPMYVLQNKIRKKVDIKSTTYILMLFVTKN